MVVLVVVLVVVPGAGVVVLHNTQQFGAGVVPPPGAGVVVGFGTAQPVIVGPGQPLGGASFGAEQLQPDGPEHVDDPSSQYKPSIGHQTHSPTQDCVGGCVV